jgi:hypothetical protein
MRLDASYNLCSKLGSKLIFGRNYGSFSLAHKSARPFSDFACIFPGGGFFTILSNPIKSTLSIWIHILNLKFLTGCT